MKKYAMMTMIAILVALSANSCRERPTNEPDGDGLQEVEREKQESMDQFREWSGSDQRDSIDQKRDSILRDSMQRDSSLPDL